MSGGTKYRHREAVIRARIAHWQKRLDAALAAKRQQQPAPKPAKPPSQRQIKIECRRVRLARLAARSVEARS
jgi:hypothetical protein